MSDESTTGQGGQEAAEPNEEELREQLEDEIRKVKIADLILQSVVSILNLAARRIAKDDERDLEQGKLGIDAARALVDLVPADAQPQLRQAISELQLLYAKHAEGDEGGPAEAAEAGAAGPGEGAEAARKPEAPAGEGKPKRDSGLWTPPGT
jgi:hypothetical protein